MLTPLVEWVLLRRRPGAAEWIAVGVSFGGAWLLAGDGRLAFDFNPGDGLILAAAVLRAAPLPALTVTAVQAGVVAAGSATLALLFAPSQWQPLPAFAGHGVFWGSVLYLVLACTLFAFFAQNYAIGRSSPTRVSLLMGSEPAFGALFASVWLGEHVSTAGWIGGGMIIAASLMATVPWRSTQYFRCACRDAGRSVKPRRLRPLLEDETEVVGQHCHDFPERKAALFSQGLDRLHVAHAPARIAPATQLSIEDFVARRRMRTVAPIRPVQVQYAPRVQTRTGAAKQRLGGFQGAMWIMLMHTMAATVPTPQSLRRTSISSGAFTFASPACVRHAAMESRESGSGSLGCQTILDSAAAQCTAC